MVHDAVSAQAWMQSGLEHVLATNDLPMLAILYRETTLVEMLCKSLPDRYDLVVITNDIYTKEDQRLLIVAGALPAELSKKACSKILDPRGDVSRCRRLSSVIHFRRDLLVIIAVSKGNLPFLEVARRFEKSSVDNHFDGHKISSVAR
jgi:hypothetical protein